MKRFAVIFFITVSFVPSFLRAQTTVADPLEKAMLAQPPGVIVSVSEKLEPNPIHVIFVNADLDGSGAFAYYVALFTTERIPAGFLRVFKRQGSNLVVAGDQDVPGEVGGFSADLDLVDVNGDGIPEVEVTSLSADAQDQYFSLFSWTGSSLHDMVGDVVGNGDLEDIDHDGTSEIVVRNPDGKNYDILKLTGATYQFLKSVPEDPSGLRAANGALRYVRAFCTVLDPDRFSQADIRESSASKDKKGKGGVVTLRFGGLRQFDGTQVTVDEIDTTTLVAGANVPILRVSVDPQARIDKEDRRETCRQQSSAGRVSVEVPRREFLRKLQALQFDAPLTAGDKVELKISGKLKDRTPISAIFKIRIVPDK